MQKIIDQFIKEFFVQIQEFPFEIPSFTQIYESETLLASSFNSSYKEENFISHSEIKAIHKALEKKKYFENSILLTSLEPCIMCSGSIIQSRIQTVVYFVETKPNEGISSISSEMIYSQKFFPKLVYLKNSEIEEIFRGFFFPRR